MLDIIEANRVPSTAPTLRPDALPHWLRGPFRPSPRAAAVAEAVGSALTAARALAACDDTDIAACIDTFRRAASALIPHARAGDPTAAVVVTHLTAYPPTATIMAELGAPSRPKASADPIDTSTEGDEASAVLRPTRFWVLSDIHADHGAWTLPDPKPACDAVLVAGDVGENPIRSVERLKRWFGDLGVPVVAVAGNHEPYGTDWLASFDAARKRAEQTGNVRLLERETVVLAPPRAVPVRVCGTSLWTDYRLGTSTERDRERAMLLAARAMMDHRLIRNGDRVFTPHDALAEHEASLRWLDAELAQPFAGVTVVLTHHAPHPSCIDPRYDGDPLNAAFGSDLSGLIARLRPAVWVHGHVHHARDHHPSVDGTGAPGPTRVICNARGYRHEATGWDPGLVIEVG